MSGLLSSDAPDLIAKPYAITAEVEIPQGGAEGMLATLGGHFGGYRLYLLKGKPVFTYNLLEGQQALAPGKHTIMFGFTYDGPGIGKGGTGRPEGGRQRSRQQEGPAHHPGPHDD